MGPVLLSTAGAAVDARRRRILVVDDEPDILDAVKTILEHGLPNADVLTAGSGESALDVLKHEVIDLIVSDYKMPGMNGIDFLNEARRIAPLVPRLLITAFSRDLADQLGPQAQLDQVLTKPLAPRPLIQTCARLLERPRTA